jgi:hypothetical protein
MLQPPMVAEIIALDATSYPGFFQGGSGEDGAFEPAPAGSNVRVGTCSPVVSIIDRVARRRARWPSWGVYCVEGDHDRCTMVCGCPHHLDATRKVTTLELAEPARLPFEGTRSVWKARVRCDDDGRRVCPNEGCDDLLVRVNHLHGRYSRECIECKGHRVMSASGL